MLCDSVLEKQMHKSFINFIHSKEMKLLLIYHYFSTCICYTDILLRVVISFVLNKTSVFSGRIRWKILAISASYDGRGKV